MKCLVTKLKESVSNDNLLKLGEFVLNFERSEGEDVTKRYIEISSIADIILTIKGDAYFIDAKTNENLGTEVSVVGNTGAKKVYVSNSTCEVHVNSKYKVATLGINSSSTYGKLSFTSGMDNFTTLVLGKSVITGNLSEIKHLKKLVSFTMQTDTIKGNLSDLSDLLNLRVLNLESNQVSGNLSDLQKMKELKDCRLKRGDFEGDISLLSDKLSFLSTQQGSSVLSWKGERSADANIIALESVRLGDDIDRMLINQAKCIAAPLSAESWNNRLQVYGTKTSASDEAVKTLKNKGYEVMVNGQVL